MAQDEQPDRRGQPDIDPTAFVDLGSKRIKRLVAVLGDFAKGLPEFILQ